jgi:hypothetical protein
MRRSLLRARPWQEYRTANSLFRMQVGHLVPISCMYTELLPCIL